MNVASLELSKELYELSKWGKTEFDEFKDTEFTYFIYHDNSNANNPYLLTRFEIHKYYEEGRGDFVWPAYSAGYLLRKLPHGTEVRLTLHGATASLRNNSVNYISISEYGDTPENALAKLCLELFRQGVLKKGEK